MITSLFSFVVTILTIFIVYVYYYYWNAAQYWKRRGINGPPPRLFFGNGKDVTSRFRPRPWLIQQWTKTFGSVFGIFEGVHPVLYISDLAMIKEVMSTQFNNFHGRKTNPRLGDVDHSALINVFNARGERWKRLRAISQTPFSQANLKKVLPNVFHSASNLLKLLEQSEGKSIEVTGLYHEYSLDIICRMTMGQKECKMMNNEWLKPILALFEQNFDIFPMHLLKGAPILLKSLNILLTWIGKLNNKDPLVSLTKLTTEAVRRRINERAAATEPWESKDFIDLYLDGQQNEEDTKIYNKLSPAELVSQLMIFLLAGFDTSSNTLSYTTFILAKYPKIQKKLQEEIEDYCRSEDVPFETLAELRYMDCVIKEVLRFYPLGANGNVRLCMSDTSVCGLKIQKDTLVAVDVLSVHFNKDIWGQDAEEFKPERWLSGDITSHQFLAFGSGPRICLGKKLAYLEIKMALVHILRKYSIKPCSDTEAELDLVGSLTIAPSSVHVKLVEGRL